MGVLSFEDLDVDNGHPSVNTTIFHAPL